MVESLDEIPYDEMPKWGQTARFIINTKQKLGLGLPKSAEQKKLKVQVNNNTVYWDKLDKLVNDYNNTRHSSIKMTSLKASKKEDICGQ